MEITIFTDKELELIESMTPGKTATEIVSIVLRDWFKSNADRLYRTKIPDAQVVDELVMDVRMAAEETVPQQEDVSSGAI